jgi:4-hydroxybenzoate polyprenyltransferase
VDAHLADAHRPRLLETEPAPSPRTGSERAAARSGSMVPLVVALEGTLVSTNILAESCLVLAKTRPLQLFRLPFWLARGRAWFKRRLAIEAMPDLATLPYNSELLTFLKAQKQMGRRLVLATGADAAVARGVAQTLGLFDTVLATDGAANLTGQRMRDRLVLEFEEKGFDYAGSAERDRDIWQVARKAILVAPTASLREIAARTYDVDRVFEMPPPGAAAHLHALRPHHWLKSGLVFLPLLVTHQLYDASKFVHAVLAFGAVSLCASSIYLLNDLLDLPDDRRHPHKKDRMLASGRLPVGRALVMTPLLLLGAALASVDQPPQFFAVIALYCLLMLAYCLRLRDFGGWDVLTLAVGYSLRVVAGGAAASIETSIWLLTSCFFLFLGLALLKRYAEMVTIRSLRGLEGRVRAYAVADSGLVALLGGLSTALALLPLAVHLAMQRPLHARYEVAWICLVLLVFWLTRMWLLAGLGYIKNDPVAFALTDRVSRTVGILMAVTMLIAT